MSAEREQVLDEMLIRQLRAIRELVDNTLVMLGEEPTAAPGGPCAHPPDRRRVAAVMGAPDRFFCTACEAFVGEAPVPAEG